MSWYLVGMAEEVLAPNIDTQLKSFLSLTGWETFEFV
jgi:hypothetical protein